VHLNFPTEEDGMKKKQKNLPLATWGLLDMWNATGAKKYVGITTYQMA